MKHETPLRSGARCAVLALAVYLSSPAMAWATEAFQESAGQVVIESEHYDANLTGLGKTWTLASSRTGFSGTGYMGVWPDTGAIQSTGYVGVSPELSFNINFMTTGTYFVWIRAFKSAGGNDTIHAGIDGAGPSSAQDIGTFYYNKWAWDGEIGRASCRERV